MYCAAVSSCLDAPGLANLCANALRGAVGEFLAMEASVQNLAGGAVIQLKGRFDIQAAPCFEKALSGAFSGGSPRIIIDLADLEYIGSAGVRSLLVAWKRAQAEDRFVELIRARPDVKKVLMVVGLGDLLPVSDGVMQIMDLFRQDNPQNHQALNNARTFLADLFMALGIEARRAREVVKEIFTTCQALPTLAGIESELKSALRELKLSDRIRDSLSDRSRIIHGQIAPHLGAGSLLDIGAGDGAIGAAFGAGGRHVQLMDVVDYNRTGLPFALYDGMTIPFPDKSFDNALLIVVLHHCADPLRVLREARRVARRRIIVIESVYLSEPNRRFNMFFDWFYNRVLHDGVPVPFNFNSPEGWEHIFRREGFEVAASVDIGLDQVTVPEYHWLYALDIPA